jgi:glycosyltransferase involved in cell wall biosynthesis
MGSVDVLVVMPSLPARYEMRQRALASITDEDVSYKYVVQYDNNGRGPAVCRNNGIKAATLMGYTSEWIAFLDDDDMFKPGHLTKCVLHAEATGADVVYPWFDLVRLGKPRNDWAFLLVEGKDAFGQEFNADALRKNNYIPVTALVRRSMFEKVGGFPVPGSEEWPHVQNEDWGLWLRLLDAGAKFSHLPERTWTWDHHGKNTSGRPDMAAKIYGSPT